MTKIKRILLILSSVNLGGGVQSKVMDIYRNIDRQKIQFDFFIQTKSEETFEDEIEKLGGRVFYFGKLNEIGKLRFLKFYLNILNKHEYAGVHSFLNINDGVMLYLAKKKGIEIRISHVRGAFIDKKFKRSLFPLLQKFTVNNATILLANSQHAGKYFFGNNNYDVIPNAFDINKYLIKTPKETNKLKENLNINQSDIVMGHIGRFSKEKNHSFLIQIGSILEEKDVDFKMLIVGSGPLKEKIQNQIEQLGLQEKILLLEYTDEIHKYYKVFDLFLFPSLHEGFGNVALEAQASGLKVLSSDKVPKEIDLNLNLVEFLSIETTDEWIKSIVSFRKKEIEETFIEERLVQRGFSILESVKYYYKLYEV